MTESLTRSIPDDNLNRDCLFQSRSKGHERTGEEEHRKRLSEKDCEKKHYEDRIYRKCH